MAKTKESIENIIAEMRRGTRLPGYWRSCDVNEILQYHADRIEAAHRREMSKIVSKQLGDAAAMRERDEMLDALVRIGNWCALDLAENAYISDPSGNYLKTLNGLCEVCKPFMQKSSKLKRYGGAE